MSPLRASIALVFLFVLFAASSALPAPSTLAAPTTSSTHPDASLPASRPVVPRSCLLTAQHLELGPHHAMMRGACLRGAGGRVLLRARKICWDRGELRAKGAKVALCPCGPREPLFHLGASRIWRYRGSQRLHLLWPTLHLGPVPIAVLPYLALPLRPGVSGLMPPEIGYSGRDGLRLGQAVYLAARRSDLLVSGGWIQTRGPTARLRLRTLWGARGGAKIHLAGLRDGARWRGGIRGCALLRGERWALGGRVALASDGGYFHDLATEAPWVFAPATTSRLWGSWRLGPVVSEVHLDLYQPTSLVSFGDTRGFLGGGGSVVLAALPLGPLLFDGTISLDGLGLLGEPWAPSYAGQSDRDGLLWQVAPTLTLARMVGPLAIDGRVGYRLRGLWTEVDDLRGEQALGARLTAGVPVSRYFGERSLEHRIEPFLGVAETAGESLSHAFFSALPLARLSLFEAGIVSSLARVSSGREILHLRLRGLYEARSERWLATGTFTLNHQLGEVAFRGVYDLSRSRIAWAEARACGRPLARLQICAGYLRQGLEELWPLFAMETGLPSAVAFPDALVDRVDGSVAWGLGPFRVDVHVRVDPIRGVMTHADYAARYESPCRCFSVGVVGRSYRGRAMPDVLLRVTLAPGPLGACLRALVP